jgi:murein DD-endopeptidase MepM/ murein hydrolase activator NlpD
MPPPGRAKIVGVTAIHRIFSLTGASLAALLVASLGAARAEPADIAAPDEARIAAERLLGSDGEDRAFAALLPFTRQFAMRGTIGAGLAETAERAGVPASALIEPLQALSGRLDLEKDLAADDRFVLRWKQTFNGDGRPIGLARVLGLDLATSAKGSVSMIRFRPFSGPVAGSEHFFFADGTLAAPPPIRLPLDDIKVTSGFGLRRDPLDQPARAQPVEVQPAAPLPPPEPAEPPPLSAAAMGEVTRAYAGFGNGEQLGNVRNLTPGLHNNEIDRIMAERRLRRLEEEARRKADEQAEAERQAARQAAAEKAAAARAANPPPPPPKPTVLYMHEGLDLLAHLGTPVHAAADGLVVLARPDRGYGNAIHLEHERGALTLYAHLARFAPGIEPGTVVRRGDVIGFVGSTGRSTGAHLHFEFLLHGRPVDPASGTVPIKLGAADLVRLKRQLAVEESLRNEPRKNDRAPMPIAMPDQVAKAE